MNDHVFKGKWKQIKGEVQREWGKLTENDLDMIEGEVTRLHGVIQEKYGHSADEVKEKVNSFLESLNDEDWDSAE